MQDDPKFKKTEREMIHQNSKKKKNCLIQVDIWKVKQLLCFDCIYGNYICNPKNTYNLAKLGKSKEDFSKQIGLDVTE